MNRKDFLKVIEEEVRGVYSTHGCNNSKFQFSLMLNNGDEEKDLKNQLAFLFENFNEKLGVKKLDYYNEHIFKKEFDEDFLEEINEKGLEEELESYKYFVTFDANELYDFFAEKKALKFKNDFVYRIENEEGKGLYSGIGLKLLQNFDTQESPNEDPALNHIFHNSNHYSASQHYKKWKFGFKDKNASLAWIHDESLLDKLSASGLKIVKYEVSEANVVHGKQQSIFIYDKAKKIEEISLLDLRKEVIENNKKDIKPKNMKLT